MTIKTEVFSEHFLLHAYLSMTKMIFSEFIINKVNEENAHKIRPLLNNILDDTDTSIGEENSVNYLKTIQYLIVTNYMGDPTSTICIEKTSSNKISRVNCVLKTIMLELKFVKY